VSNAGGIATLGRVLGGIATLGRVLGVGLVPLGIVACIVNAPGDLPKQMLHAVVGNHHQEFLYYEEARTATVSVIHNTINDERQLLVNAVNEVTTRLVHDQSFKLLGHLGPLLHPNPKRAVMICLGAGLAAGSALAHPLERLDVVDLLGAVKNGARYFAEENNHVLDDPRLHLHVNDGRQYLLTSHERYDVAIVDSTHPKSVDSWILYTQEFFQLLRDRLSEGGIVVQWLPLHGLSEQEFRSVVATFASVFPQMQLWASVGFETYGQVGYAKLVGQRSPSPLRIDCERLQSRLRATSVQHDVRRYAMGDLPSILDQFVAGPTRIRHWTEGSPVHRDDRPFLSYVTSLSAGRSMTPDRLMAVRESARPFLVNTPAAGSEQDVAMGLAFTAAGFTIEGQLQAASAADLGSEKVARYVQQSHTSLSYCQELARRYPTDEERQFEVATQLMALGHVDEAALAYQAAIRASTHGFRARLNRALLWLDTGDPKAAAAQFSALLAEKPGVNLLRRNLGVALLAQNEPGAAHQQLLAAARDAPTDTGARSALIDAEMALGRWDAAQVQLRELEQLLPFDASVVERQARVREEFGDIAGAHSLWRVALQLEPFHDQTLVAWSRHLSALECDAASAMLDGEPYRYWSSSNVALARGYTYCCAERWEAAAQAFVDVLEEDPRSGEGAVGLGRALGRLHRFEEGAEALCVGWQFEGQRRDATVELQQLGKSAKDCKTTRGRFR
jgi:spermidine synthase/tetratricopeptide (TPR) repeat protein